MNSSSDFVDRYKYMEFLKKEMDKKMRNDYYKNDSFLSMRINENI